MTPLRLADMLVHQTTRHVAFPAMASLYRDIVRALREYAVLFSIEETAHFFYEDVAQEHWNTGDFTCVIPPYPVTWMEYTRPKFINSDGKIVPSEGLPAMAGVLIAFERDSGEVFFEMASRAGLEAPFDRAGTEFVVSMDFMTYEETAASTVGPIVRYTYFLDSTGALIGNPLIAVDENFRDHPLMEGLTSAAPTYVFLFALDLLNCKNVYTDDVNPVNPDRAMRRRGASWTGLRFKTLRVPQIQKVRRQAVERSRRAAVPGVSIHTVRAHMKTYTEAAPLLGKHVGTWFWASQVRGSPDLGEVVKEYELERTHGHVE